MRICVTSSGPSLDSFVDPRFGRCLYFIFVDEEDDERKIDIVQNDGVNAIQGAGIMAAQIVINQKAEVVITGNIGPNPFEILKSSGVRIFQAPPGIKVRDALVEFKENKLIEITSLFRRGFGPGGRFRFRHGFGHGRRDF